MTTTKRIGLVVNNKAPAEIRIMPPRTIAEILSEPLPTYAVRPLLAHRAVHVIFGDANCGKTFFALDLAAVIAVGGDWMGHRIKAAPVLYVAAEGRGGFGKRIRALVHKYPGLPSSAFRTVPQSINLIEMLDDILIRAKDLADDQGNLGLIVLDTLAQTMAGGDENGSGDMSAYVQAATTLAERTKAPVLIAHHEGKNGQYRGHSSLRGNIDAMYRLTDKDGVRTLTCEKARDDEVAPLSFSLRVVSVGCDDDGNEQTSCVVEYLEGVVQPEKKQIVGEEQRLLLRLATQIATANAENGRLAPNGRPVIEKSTLIEVWLSTRRAAGRKRNNPSYISRPLNAVIEAGYLVPVEGADAWTLT